MLTESTGGKGTGLGKGRKTKGTQTVDLWSSLARMSDLAVEPVLHSKRSRHNEKPRHCE